MAYLRSDDVHFILYPNANESLTLLLNSLITIYFSQSVFPLILLS